MISPPVPPELEREYLKQDPGHVLLITAIIIIILETVFIAAYGFSKFPKKSRAGVEARVLMPAAYIFCIGNCIVGILMVQVGHIGRDRQYQFKYKPKVAETYYKLIAAAELIYGFSITLPRLAIIYTYLKIFDKKWVRRLTHFTGDFMISNLITIIILYFLSCHPIRTKWDINTPGGRCNTTQAYIYVGIPNIMSDIIIILLPIPTIIELRISTFKKILVFISFVICGLGIVTAGLRLQTFISYYVDHNSKFSQVSAMTWTIIEPAAYFICACLPGVRPLLQRVYDWCKDRRLFGWNGRRELKISDIELEGFPDK